MNRIELSSSAWEADALPLCYTRINKPIGLELPQTVKRNKAQTIMVYTKRGDVYGNSLQPPNR